MSSLCFLIIIFGIDMRAFPAFSWEIALSSKNKFQRSLRSKEIPLKIPMLMNHFLSSDFCQMELVYAEFLMC